MSESSGPKSPKSAPAPKPRRDRSELTESAKLLQAEGLSKKVAPREASTTVAPTRTPGKAEGDRQTIDEALAKKADSEENEIPPGDR